MATYKNPGPKDRGAAPRPHHGGRREILTLGAAGAAALALPGGASAGQPTGTALAIARRSDHAGGEKPTPWDDVTTYNNFYELGAEKWEPAQRAGSLRPRPWTVAITGEVKKPQTIAVDD